MARVRSLVAIFLFIVCAVPGFAGNDRNCNIDPHDLHINAAGHPFTPGETFWAEVFLDKHESVRWEVRGGTIVDTTPAWIQIVSGPPGVVEVDAFITKNDSCEQKVSASVPVFCQDDPTIGLFFDKGGATVGETVKAWVNLREGLTARWEVTNGTPATAEGDSIEIVAGGTEGHMFIDVYISDAYCTMHRRALIFMYR